jgi:hypothetical protein
MFTSPKTMLIRVTAIAVAVVGSVGFITTANAQQDYGDLIILLRDDSGVPMPSPEVLVPDPETGLLVDGGLCWQPIAFVPDPDPDNLCPAECVIEATTPATVSVDQFNCGVAAGCSGCTKEVDIGRVNSARAPDRVFESQLEDVIVTLSTADCITLDPAGRLVASHVVDDIVTTKTIDSPLQNLAIYRQLLLDGFLGDAVRSIDLPGSAFDTAARGLGAAIDKTSEVNVDLVAYLNLIMELDERTTILDPKICETFREEVQGVIQLVEKCYLDYGAFGYDRTSNFGGLPAPPHIPAGNPQNGWFEHLAEINPQQQPPDPPLFHITRGPTLPAVFDVDPGFTNGRIGGFAQAADDTRAVINFMHDWPVPDADVFGTPVVCAGNPGLITYDVAISEQSGLQVPMQMVDGGDGREFFVTVSNMSSSPDPATGTLTVTAVPESGGVVFGSPWVFEFTDLAPGTSQSWTTFFNIGLGEETTINWTATADATHDVNLGNNTVTATTNVIVTSSDTDEDDDGLLDVVDNCTVVFNPLQIDVDGDGFGNFCDPDFNNDGIVNIMDMAYLKATFFTDDALADLNGDGVVNAEDLGILSSMFFAPPGPSCCGVLP